MTLENYGEMYRSLHERKQKVFSGKSIRPGVPHIARLVSELKPRRMLDYGCGKGIQYSELHVHKEWGGMLPYCYDPGVERFSKRPNGVFDAVICTDVMEHIAEPDVMEILNDIFTLVPERRDGGISFAFFWIACRPARRKTLPDGRNVHLTVEPPEWWQARLDWFKRDKLVIEAHYDLGDEAEA
jgi:hypothetical protein